MTTTTGRALRTALPVLALAAACAACGSSGGSAAGTAGTAKSTTKAASQGTSTGAESGGGAETIGTSSGSSPHLVDGSGRTVYLWVADTSTKSTCTGPCASAWPPVITTGDPTATGGAVAARLGTSTRPDGSTQVTYDGHPLYYYAGDNGSGSTSGQGSDGFGAKWWLVAPSGSAITTTASGSSGSSDGDSGGGGYGAGY